MAEVLFRARLQRDENKTAWGFRLQGGADFCRPLTLLSVRAESIASRGGLEAGDIIVKIAGKATESMTHKDAQQAIIDSGNLLEIIVERAEATITSPISSPTGVLSPQGSASPPPGEVITEELHRGDATESQSTGNDMDERTTSVREVSVKLSQYSTEYETKEKRIPSDMPNAPSENIPVHKLEKLKLSEEEKKDTSFHPKEQLLVKHATSADSVQKPTRYVNRLGTGFYDPGESARTFQQRAPPSPPSPPPDIMAQDYEILRQISVKQLKSRFNVDEDTSQRLASAFMAERYGPPPSVRSYTPNVAPSHWQTHAPHPMSSSTASSSSSTSSTQYRSQFTPGVQRAVNTITAREALYRQWEEYKRTGMSREERPLFSSNERRMSQQRRVHFSDNLEHVREIESRRDPDYHNPSIFDDLGLHEIEVDLETYANPPPQSRSLKVLDAGFTQASEPPPGSLTRLYRTNAPSMLPPRPASPVTTQTPSMMNSLGESKSWTKPSMPLLPNNTLPASKNQPSLPPGIFAFFDKSFLEKFLQYQSERAFTEKFMQWQHEREKKATPKSETLRMVQEMDFRKEHPPWTDL